MRRIARMMACGLALACAAGQAHSAPPNSEVEYARKAGEWGVVGGRQGDTYVCQAMRRASPGEFALRLVLELSPFRLAMAVGVTTALPAGSKVTGTITVDKRAAFPLEAATVSKGVALLEVEQNDWVRFREALRAGRSGSAAVVIYKPAGRPEMVSVPLDGIPVALDLANLCMRQMIDLASAR